MDISRSRFSRTFFVILLDLKSMALIATVSRLECCALVVILAMAAVDVVDPSVDSD